MPMPITPELAAFMRSLGYDQLRQAYKEKYGKPYPMFCLSETKISGAEYMEECAHNSPVKIWMNSLNDTPTTGARKKSARSWTLWWMSWCAGKTGTRPDLRLNVRLSAFK